MQFKYSIKELLDIINDETIKMIIYSKFYGLGAIYYDISIIANNNIDIIESSIINNNKEILIEISNNILYNIPIENIIGMVAHELGHIIYNHYQYINIINNRIKNAIEIQADLYAVRILSIIGYNPLCIIEPLKYLLENAHTNYYRRDFNNFNKNILELTQKRIDIVNKYIQKKY